MIPKENKEQEISKFLDSEPAFVYVNEDSKNMPAEEYVDKDRPISWEKLKYNI